MTRTINNMPLPAAPWFKSWFNSAYYHQLYAHRNDREAQNFIDELINELEPVQDCFMLDLGCGAGRHSKYLASRGFRVMGLDLSTSSIREARKSDTSSVQFYQHDMREPFGIEQFDYVFSFFTSFGYFKTPGENQQVIRNISNSLKRGGKLVFDYLNPDFAEARLIPYEEKEIDGIVFYITRWADHSFIYKKIVVNDARIEQPLEFVEQVSKFRLDNFLDMFSQCNLQTVRVFGDYKLQDYDMSESPRLIMVTESQA